jgi:hypothetical protein
MRRFSRGTTQSVGENKADEVGDTDVAERGTVIRNLPFEVKRREGQDDKEWG